MAFSFIGFREFAGMVTHRGIVLERTGGILAAALTVLVATAGNFTWMNLAFFFSVALLAWVHILRGMAHHTIAGLAASVLGVVYLGWFGAPHADLHAAGGGAGVGDDVDRDGGDE